jgi:hypothetical protein
LTADQLHIDDLQGNGVQASLEPIKLCGSSGSRCLVKAIQPTASETATGTPTHLTAHVSYTYEMLCIQGTSSLGPWQSCDFFAVKAP